MPMTMFNALSEIWRSLVRWCGLNSWMESLRAHQRTPAALQQYVRLQLLGGAYRSDGGSTAEMELIGDFLCDVGLRAADYKQWFCSAELLISGTNTTFVDEDNGSIVLTSAIPGIENPVEVKMSPRQIVQLLDEWEEKVCKPTPQEVKIICEDGQYRIAVNTMNVLLRMFYKWRWDFRSWKIGMRYWIRAGCKSYVELRYNGTSYQYDGSSGGMMYLIEGLLRDMGLDSVARYRQWVLGGQGAIIGEGVSLVKQDGGRSVIMRSPPEVVDPSEVKISVRKFIKLLDDWDTKVCARRPKFVTVSYRFGRYSVETSDQ